MALFTLTKVFYFFLLIIIIMLRCKLSHSILIFYRIMEEYSGQLSNGIAFHLSFGRLHAQCRESEKADKVIHIAICV